MEFINAYKTADGKIFATREEATEHEFGQQLTDRLDRFSADASCPYPDGVANMQMRKSIQAWELAKVGLFKEESIGTLDFTVRTLNCLKAENISTVKHLLEHSEGELLKTPNLGRKSLNEIREKLATFNLKLSDQ